MLMRGKVFLSMCEWSHSLNTFCVFTKSNLLKHKALSETHSLVLWAATISVISVGKLPGVWFTHRRPKKTLWDPVHIPPVCTPCETTVQRVKHDKLAAWTWIQTHSERWSTWAAESLGGEPVGAVTRDRKDSSLLLFSLPSQYLASSGLPSVVDTWAPPPCVCLAQLVQHTDSCKPTPQETRSSPVSHPRSCLTEGPSEERGSQRHSAESLRCDWVPVQWMHRRRQEKMLWLPLRANKEFRSCVWLCVCTEAERDKTAWGVITHTHTQRTPRHPLSPAQVYWEHTHTYLYIVWTCDQCLWRGFGTQSSLCRSLTERRGEGCSPGANSLMTLSTVRQRPVEAYLIEEAWSQNLRGYHLLI